VDIRRKKRSIRTGRWREQEKVLAKICRRKCIYTCTYVNEEEETEIKKKLKETETRK
jgi:hypothetical protein